ncbi:sulfatase-like hydrolase/transferase [Paenibacillus sp.]|uniref:sulfatase-like hydrolase/transferase n=1 Tax=Paenibacillus sp. TaxID=58172 RepID=UPI002D326AFB|nr:sulfatase-like hydrolase/transferase [Paenibacillus sp.]HZG84034.1 sulfatase-like hydrolase/transferase [Paenibacillus sp.]
MKHKPNFVFIHTDQQRADCLGIEGRRKGLYTPNLDFLAVSGMRFSAAYATTPVCIPQRLTFLSGQTASMHGVLGNTGIPYFPFETTLPSELSKGGYQTALVGRTFHTYPFDHPYGFEYYMPGDPSSEFKDSTDPFFTFLREHAPEGSGGYYGNGTDNNSYIGAPFHLPNELHHTQWTTERALEFLQVRDSDRPFLLTVGYYAPHGPQNPPAEFFDRYYYNQDLDNPVIGEWAIPPVANWSPTRSSYVDLSGELLRSCRAGYYGNITFIDLQLGRIINRVRQIPNTYIIFTSDHGEMLGDHYLYHKAQPYEGAAHIPFLIAGPDVSPMQVCDKTIGWHDIMPTMLDLAGLPIPDHVDGQSLAPLLQNPSTSEWREYLHGECSRPMSPPKLPGQATEGNMAYETGFHYLTDGKTKYIWHTQSGREQLFDLMNDPHERFDLSAKAEYANELTLWRGRLIDEIKDRPEGFTDGERLIAGRKYASLLPKAQEIVDRRLEEGYAIAYYQNRKTTKKT